MTTDRTPLHRAGLAYPDGAISHRAAARLFGLPVPPASPDETVDVIRPRAASDRAAIPGIRVHTTRRWSADDYTTVETHLTVTSPARTVLDLAGAATGSRRLRHLVQAGLTAGVLTIEDLNEQLERTGGHGVAGSGRLGQLLADLTDLAGQEPIPQSELEWRLATLLDRRFHRQFRPPWYDGVRGIVDLADPVSRTIVEADGRRWHTAEQAMADDRRRDRAAAANGWIVLRVTWADVVHRPELTAAEIETTLIRRARSAA